MAPKADAAEVRETIEDSIEAKGAARRAETADVEMRDAEEENAEGEEDAEGEVDAEGEEEEEDAGGMDLLQTIQELATFLCAYKEE